MAIDVADFTEIEKELLNDIGRPTNRLDDHGRVTHVPLDMLFRDEYGQRYSAKLMPLYETRLEELRLNGYVIVEGQGARLTRKGLAAYRSL